MIMRNDPNNYGTPPATEDSVKNLDKVKFSKKVKKIILIFYKRFFFY